MGKKNSVLTVYMNDARRIQSVLEYYLGRKLPEDWTVNCRDAQGFYSAKDMEGKFSFRQRDIWKKVIAQDGIYYLGIENQENINLLFPFRLMQMDCLAYEKQIQDIRQRNIQEAVAYHKEDDFLYRFRAQDCLQPIVNLVLYWGRKPWKNPLGIGDMTAEAGLPCDMQELFMDYRIHLISMRTIPQEALEQMESDLKYVLGILKCSDSAAKCREYIQQNRTFFEEMPRDAAEVVAVYMNIRGRKQMFSYEERENGEEYLNMCKAIDDMKKQAAKEGKREAREGAIRKVMKNLHMTAEQAMDVLEIPKKEQAYYLQILR